MPEDLFQNLGLDHAMTNAVVMRMVLNSNRPAIEHRIARAAAYLGNEGGFDGFPAHIMTLRDSLSIPQNLAAFWG